MTDYQKYFLFKNLFVRLPWTESLVFTPFQHIFRHQTNVMTLADIYKVFLLGKHFTIIYVSKKLWLIDNLKGRRHLNEKNIFTFSPLNKNFQN